MTQENKEILLRLLQRYHELGIADQIDFEKFYLYSIIVHSTAIEGSTVTEVEAQLLFDEGITSSKRTMHGWIALQALASRYRPICEIHDGENGR